MAEVAGQAAARQGRLMSTHPADGSQADAKQGHAQSTTHMLLSTWLSTWLYLAHGAYVCSTYRSERTPR